MVPRSLLSAAILAALLSGLATESRLAAQEQPAVARNAQDEIVTIDKSVGAETSEFRIFRSGDKSEMNRYVAKTYRLENANPFELKPYLRGITSLEKGSVNTVSSTDPETGKKMYWIQVNAPEFQIPYIDQLIEEYDVAGFTSGSGSV